MENLNAWIESPFAEDEKNWIKSSVQKVTEMYTESLILAGIYQDATSFSTTPRQEDGPQSLLLKALLSNRLKCLNSTPLLIGTSLSLELSLDNQKDPLKALAVVVRQLPQQVNGYYYSAIRIVAIRQAKPILQPQSPEARPSVESLRQLQLNWAIGAAHV
jgi:hypothetical protein